MYVVSRALWAVAFCLFLMVGGLQAAALPGVPDSGISLEVQPTDADPWEAVALALAAHRQTGTGGGLADMADEALRLAKDLTTASDSDAYLHASPSDWLQLAPAGLPGVDEARLWLDALLSPEPASGGEDGSFHLSHRLIEQAIQSGWPNEETTPGMAHLLGSLQNPANLLAMLESVPFLSADDAEKGSTLEHLPQLLTALYPSPEPAAPLPPMREFPSLPAAVEALYAWYGETVDADELERLTKAPASQAEPLARIIAAHMLQAEVTDNAFEGLDSEEAPSTAALFRVALATAVAAMTADAAASTILCDPNGPTDYGSGIFQYDLSCEDSRYAYNARLVVDLGGDDVYMNNAGGGSLSAATLVDAGGDDRYDATLSPSSAVMGAGSFGSGLLVDLSGNDAYTGEADDAAIGAGYEGIGILVDQSGNDEYAATADVAAIGAGFYGLGMLIDESGNDTYDGTATSEYGTDHIGAAVGAGNQGTGFLIDRNGNDKYTATAGRAAVGAGHWGMGILIDESGSDTYNATASGVGGAAVGAGVFGTGILIDRRGNDEYTATAGRPAIGAAYAGLGVVLDESGNNSYIGGPGGVAQGAAEYAGLGLLIDHGTSTTFRLLDGATGQGAGILGVGLLLRTNPDGVTTYLANPGAVQGQQGAVGVGMQIDVGAVTPGSTLPTLECPGDAYVDEEVPTAVVVWQLRVCSPHDSTNQQMNEPCLDPNGCPEEPLTVGDGPEGTLQKPPVPCSSIPGCPAIAELLPGDGWSDWLEREYVKLTFNGGLSVSYRDYVGSASPLLLSTFTPAKVDNVPWCDPECTEA